jgi:hypothetical protein
VNVIGDGHCAYRCFAYIMRNSEHDWDLMRNQIYEWPSKQPEEADRFFKKTLLQDVLKDVQWSKEDKSFPTVDKWFHGTDQGQLAAFALNRPIVLLDPRDNSSQTYLPHQQPTPDNERPIILLFNPRKRHYQIAELEDNAGFPPITEHWKSRMEETLIGKEWIKKFKDKFTRWSSQNS